MATYNLEREVQRLADIHEINNIMGKYAYLTMAGLINERNELFAKRPDTRVYFGEQGYFEGPDAPQRAWGGMYEGLTDEEIQEQRKGRMTFHFPICPVIEVAGDGKTAKGVWIGIGLLCGAETATWEWDKYGDDFIKEDARWKIWHHHIYRLLHGLGWDEKWAEQFFKPEPEMRHKTDGPAVDDNPFRPDTVQRLVPKPPEPYETWEDTFMY